MKAIVNALCINIKISICLDVLENCKQTIFAPQFGVALFARNSLRCFGFSESHLKLQKPLVFVFFFLPLFFPIVYVSNEGSIRLNKMLMRPFCSIRTINT